VRAEEYSSSAGAGTAYDDHFEVVVDGCVVRVHRRPGLDAFLRFAAERFELIAFTAGLEWYAAPVLDALDPTRSIFRHRLFRQHCVFNSFFAKDLRILNRPMHRTVLVDNSVSSFWPQLRNGIPIMPFVDDPHDSALATLLQFLCTVEAEPDVRPLLDQVFSLERTLGLVVQQATRAQRAGLLVGAAAGGGVGWEPAGA